MFEHIIKINDRGVLIKLNASEKATNVMGYHLVLESDRNKIICEIDGVYENELNAHFIGEIVDDKFRHGVLNKPDINSSIRLINDNEIALIIGVDSPKTFTFGTSPFYNNREVYVNINTLFSNHLTILGNSGSGKSYGTASIIQHLFKKAGREPYRASFIFFDNNGEYISAFKNMNSWNPNYHFKVITTSKTSNYQNLAIPLWLLSVDDIALLLSATTSNQMILIERMIKLARIFSQNIEMNSKYKNHLLAKIVLIVVIFQ